MKDDCETFQAALSALIDGELEVPDQLPAVDHLLECASCRAFYRRARALGNVLVSSPSPWGERGESSSEDDETAPEEVWERIAAASGLGQRRAGWGVLRRPSRWALQLAAVLLLGLGLWWIRPAPTATAPEPSPVADAGGEVEVILEEDEGAMTDERFVELATELLRADRSYHRKMFEVMSVVTAVSERPEGSVDERTIAVREGARRVSVGEGDGDGEFVWSGERL